MAAFSHSSPSPRPVVTADSSGADGGSIDLSTRGPVLFFTASAAVWLLIGSLFALISSFKLHSPGFLDDCAWLTYGRTHGAENATLLYGWGCNAAFALVLWLLARLSQAHLRQPLVLVVAGLFWNLGVTLGVVGLLAGDGTALDGLEMPAYASPLLFLAYLFIGTWAFLTYRTGRSEHVYISQWYVLGALFWFPWMFSIATIMLFVDPTRGTVQSLVHVWFSQGLLNLWFLPLAIGLIYYFLPKLLGRPISNYYLSVYGFWVLAACGGWTGVSRLIGGPVPAWVVSAGIAASFLMVVSIVVVAVNFLPTMMASGGSTQPRDPSYRFIAFGAIALLVSMTVSVLFSIRGVAEITQFSFLSVAQFQLTFYGVFSMVAFGALYYALPRVAGRAWPMSGLVSLHFGLAALGILLSVVALAIGGYAQGQALNALPHGAEAAPTPFAEIVKSLSPYLFARTAAWLVMLVGHLAFAANVCSLARAACCCCAGRSSDPTSAGCRAKLEGAR